MRVSDIDAWRLRPLAVGALALAIALAFRMPVIARADFPVYDGGLFSVMTSELAANGFAIPRFTSYNGGDIPFAYPPLGLYVTAALQRATGWPLVFLVQWLPLLVSLATVAVFASLARRTLNSRRAAALATLCFPLLPYSAQWLIMGHGVTRGLGFLFVMLAANALLATMPEPRPFRLTLAALATAGAVLSHPEFGLLALLTVALIPLLLADGWARLVIPAVVASGALVLSAPWWGTVLLRFGAAPFRAAASSTPFSIGGVLGALAVFPLTAEPHLRVLGVLGILGTLVLAATWRPFVPAWFLLTLVAIPRNGPTPMTIPFALAVGVCLDELLLPAAAVVGSRSGHRWAPAVAPIVLGAWVFGYAGLENWLLLRQADVLLPVLSEGEREVSAWVAGHTAHDSVFLLVTSTSEEQRDPLVEWFPALSGRASAVTPQGGEWIGRFGERAHLAAGIKGCQAAGLACIHLQTAKGPVFTHVLLGREQRGPLGLETMRAELTRSPDYRLVHDGPGGTVFERVARR
jgi:hypothetical protein